MNTATCLVCNAAMEPGTRRPRKTCSGKCRAALSRRRRSQRTEREISETLALLRAMRSRDEMLDAD